MDTINKIFQWDEHESPDEAGAEASGAGQKPHGRGKPDQGTKKPPTKDETPAGRKRRHSGANKAQEQKPKVEKNKKTKHSEHPAIQDTTTGMDGTVQMPATQDTTTGMQGMDRDNAVTETDQQPATQHTTTGMPGIVQLPADVEKIREPIVKLFDWDDGRDFSSPSEEEGTPTDWSGWLPAALRRKKPIHTKPKEKPKEKGKPEKPAVRKKPKKKPKTPKKPPPLDVKSRASWRGAFDWPSMKSGSMSTKVELLDGGDDITQGKGSMNEASDNEVEKELGEEQEEEQEVSVVIKNPEPAKKRKRRWFPFFWRKKPVGEEPDTDEEGDEEEEEEEGPTENEFLLYNVFADAISAERRSSYQPSVLDYQEGDELLETMILEDGAVDPANWEKLTPQQQTRLQQLAQLRHTDARHTSRSLSVVKSGGISDDDQSSLAGPLTERQKRLNKKIQKEWGDMTRAELRKYLVSVFFNIMFSHTGLLTVLLVYSLIGAYIFPVLEKDNERKYKTAIIDHRKMVVERAWNTHVMALPDEEYKKTVYSYVNWVRSRIVKSLSDGITTHSSSRIWSLWGALFFVATIYTTIGYGSIAPVTDTGRMATVIYGMFGIPLFLLVMVNFGTTLKEVIKDLWGYVDRLSMRARKNHWIPSAEPDVDADAENAAGSGPTSVAGEEEHKKSELPPIIAIIIVLMHILAGTFMYTRWETWSVPEAFYFIFVSLTTIGFGDVVPSRPKLFVISFIYLLLGLSLVSMMVTVLAQAVQKQKQTKTTTEEEDLTFQQRPST